MKRKSFSLAVLAVAAVSLMVLAGCGEESIVGPGPQTSLAENQGIAAEDITWIPWKAEYLSKVLTERQRKEIQDELSLSAQDPERALEKRGGWPTWGYACENIKRSQGGTVGDYFWTLGNMVDIPSHAFPEGSRWISVFVAYLYGQPGVEFGPDGSFDKDVRVTLSFDCLNYNGNPEDLNVYWLDESTRLWVLVPNPEIDWNSKTVSVYVNHFTRYQWGL